VRPSSAVRRRCRPFYVPGRGVGLGSPASPRFSRLPPTYGTTVGLRDDDAMAEAVAGFPGRAGGFSFARAAGSVTLNNSRCSKQANRNTLGRSSME
jgi:hypothetical protein